MPGGQPIHRIGALARWGVGMDGFHDPRGYARAARIAVTIWLAGSLGYGGAALYSIVAINAHLAGETPEWGALETVDQVSQITGILYMVLTLACVVLVGMWIYRTNKNAWQVSDGMTVKPGWAVGSFFIPFLNLIRPFTGMRETWQASHFPGDPGAEPVPVLMRIWWGAWLVNGVLGQVSFRLSMRAQTLEDFLLVGQIDAVGMIVDIVAGTSLLWIMRRITAAQSHFRDYEVFE